MQNNDNNELDDKIKTVKKILKGNRARALGVATMFSLSTILGGCGAKNNQTYATPNGYFGEQESTAKSSNNGIYGSSYNGYHGGSYYYFRGASGALDGSWGKNNTQFKSTNAAASTYTGTSKSTGKSSLKSGGTNKSSYTSSGSGTSGKSGGISG